MPMPAPPVHLQSELVTLGLRVMFFERSSARFYGVARVASLGVMAAIVYSPASAAVRRTS